MVRAFKRRIYLYFLGHTELFVGSNTFYQFLFFCLRGLRVGANMLSWGFMDRILVLSGGGLVSVVDVRGDIANIWVDWPEEYSVKAMELVAQILSEQKRRQSSIILHEPWVVYVPDSNGIDFMVLARARDKRFLFLVIGFVRRLARVLAGLPEESNIVGERVVEFLQKHFRIRFRKIKKLVARNRVVR